LTLLCVVPFQSSVFCGGDFGSTIALDLQQKLKPFLHSSQDQMAIRFFLGIFHVSQKISSLNFRDF